MPSYSFQFCDHGTHVLWQENNQCTDDKNALDVARILQRADAKAIEIWEGVRWVGCLKSDHCT